jgi:hypothetical protein
MDHIKFRLDRINPSDRINNLHPIRSPQKMIYEKRDQFLAQTNATLNINNSIYIVLNFKRSPDPNA